MYYSGVQSKVEILLAILDAGKAALQALGQEGGEIVRGSGAFGASDNDPELRADVVVGRALANKCREVFGRDIEHITVEGQNVRPTWNGQSLWITIDPIDGSLNYRHRGQMTGFPYMAVVTVLGFAPQRPQAFHDIIAAGVIDLRPGIQDAWLSGICAETEQYESYVRQADGKISRAQTLPKTTLDLGQMNVIGEMWYADNRMAMAEAFAGESGWLRSIGSAAYEMASVASGQAAAYINRTQKQHELGAGYALVLGAGGVAVDWQGRDLADREYDFQTQVPCILAANQRIADQILERLNNR